MGQENKNEYDKELYKELKIDCQKCFGFCCVALYFSASEGFPTDKAGGKPCINLQRDFSCTIHKDLSQKGLKGCMAYDCFGAGQKVAQITYKGQSWQQNEKVAKQMFEAFLVMRQLHEMLWYLTEACTKQTHKETQDKLYDLINETKQVTNLDAEDLIKFNIETHRDKVNALLHQTSELIRSKALNGQKSTVQHKKMIAGRLDCIGKDLRKTNLKGADLRGAFLIGANLRGADLTGADLIGADLRDADVRGANLTESLFITQPQMNAAKGDSNTRLPLSLVRPSYWDK